MRRAPVRRYLRRMDLVMLAGTASAVVFAVSNLPMLRKAMRTGDVSSYSLASVVMINVANLVYSIYVFSLPIGPVWMLHTFYLVSCAIMLVLCLGQRRAAAAGPRRVRPGAHAAGARGDAPEPLGVPGRLVDGRAR